jgi:D-alanine-D-alanine ligase-like ATP-grasp enzyme
MVLAHYKIPTAPFVVLPAWEEVFDWTKFAASLPQYPVFVKPNAEGTSKGIESDSKAEDLAGLQSAVRRLRTRFPDQDVLVEAYLSGQEYTVGILGTGAESRVIGVQENVWPGSVANESCRKEGQQTNKSQQVDFYRATSKSLNSEEPILWKDCDEPITPRVQVALEAWRVLKCRDAGRVDIRFDSDKESAVPNVMEVRSCGSVQRQAEKELTSTRSIPLPVCFLIIRHSQL